MGMLNDYTNIEAARIDESELFSFLYVSGEITILPMVVDIY